MISSIIATNELQHNKLNLKIINANNTFKNKKTTASYQNKLAITKNAIKKPHIKKTQS